MTPVEWAGASPEDHPAMAGHVREGRRLDVLHGIAVAGVNLAIWQRPGRHPAIDRAMLEEVDDVAIEAEVAHLAADLPPALAACGYAARDAQALAADIALLAQPLASAVAVTRVAIRLDVVETDACRRFHADYVQARLICTYVGPGTQWLDDADAVRLAAGADPAALAVRHIATGDAAIFKGRLWAPDAPIVHRSPPIAASGDHRLLLVIDPAPPEPIAHA
ncbi:DUF1826 domain-containing protein [Sphingomonas adhaesiva]|uniref:DUF1826 domain-containing protein n=1 Tax=Sphingomonas adhaesiva TaxID=28212 RepID=UPI002FFA0BBF